MSGRISSVQHFLLDLQHRLCAVLESEETSQKKFQEDNWTYDKISGGRTCVLQGDIFEQAGVNFSHVI
ncbi:MAG: Coproporphyrinogen III oxidase, partial [uncultured bacterium]